jgi:hypothetical protein
VTEFPYDLRDESAKNFAQEWKANDSKKKKGDVYAMHAHFGFPNKYRKIRKLVIYAKHNWGLGVFHSSFFGMKPFRCREKLPARLSYDATLTMNWLGQVHLYIPSPLEKHASVGVHELRLTQSFLSIGCAHIRHALRSDESAVYQTGTE